jgi:hypothetical protein
VPAGWLAGWRDTPPCRVGLSFRLIFPKRDLLELTSGLEPLTSSLPRTCSTT